MKNANNLLEKWISTLFYDELGNIDNDNITNIIYGSNGIVKIFLKDGDILQISLDIIKSSI